MRRTWARVAIALIIGAPTHAAGIANIWSGRIVSTFKAVGPEHPGFLGSTSLRSLSNIDHSLYMFQITPGALNLLVEGLEADGVTPEAFERLTPDERMKKLRAAAVRAEYAAVNIVRQAAESPSSSALTRAETAVLYLVSADDYRTLFSRNHTYDRLSANPATNRLIKNFIAVKKTLLAKEQQNLDRVRLFQKRLPHVIAAGAFDTDWRALFTPLEKGRWIVGDESPIATTESLAAIYFRRIKTMQSAPKSQGTVHLAFLMTQALGDPAVVAEIGPKNVEMFLSQLKKLIADAHRELSGDPRLNLARKKLNESLRLGNAPTKPEHLVTVLNYYETLIPANATLSQLAWLKAWFYTGEKNRANGIPSFSALLAIRRATLVPMLERFGFWSAAILLTTSAFITLLLVNRSATFVWPGLAILGFAAWRFLRALWYRRQLARHNSVNNMMHHTFSL